MCDITKGWHSVECRDRILPTTVPDTMWPVAIAKRLLDTGADDARDGHESKRHKSSDETVPVAQEPSTGSGVKRSNLAAIRRADAEAEKALKRAKVLDERRAAKRGNRRKNQERRRKKWIMKSVKVGQQSTSRLQEEC